MGGLVGALRGGLAGLNEAAGNPQTAQQLYDRNTQDRNNRLQMALTPLQEALRADQTRLALYANPDDPTKPLAGKKAEYKATHDRMAQTIGQIRGLFGQKPQGPNPVEAALGNVADKLHITNHLKNLVAQKRADAAAKYQGQNQQMASDYGTAAMPPVNPYQQSEAQMRAAGFSEPDIQQAMRAKAGLLPKDTTEQERFITNYKAQHPGTTEEQALHAYTAATAKPGAMRSVTIGGPDGKPMLANYSDGKYYDQAGREIIGARPVVKPGNPSLYADWKQEHPNGTVEQYLAAQDALKPEFPRIVPVNDAKGNVVGYTTFSGTGSGVKTQYVSNENIKGLPQDLGGTPGVIPPKPTGSVLTQSQRADMIQPQVQALESQVDKTVSQLGPLAGRWAGVMAGKVGADNPEVAKLQMQLQLFTTALMLAHGLRGEAYQESLEKYLSTAQSPENLKARIQGANAYLQDYAASTGHGHGNDPQGQNGPPPGAKIIKWSDVK